MISIIKTFLTRAGFRTTESHFGVEPYGDGNLIISRVDLVNGEIVEVVTECLEAGTDCSSILRRLGIGSDSHISLVLPRHEVLAKNLRLPTKDPIALRKMIPFEAASVSPWQEEEVAYSYEDLGPDLEGYTQILLFLVKRDRLQQFIGRCTSFGLRPTHIEVSTLSLARLALRLERDSADCALLSTRPAGMEYIRLSNCKPVFSRGMATDSDIVGMLTQSLEMDERRFGTANPPSKILLAVNHPQENCLEPTLIELGIPFTRLFDSGESDSPDTRQITPAAVGCVGAALVPQLIGSTSDFLPETEARSRAIRRLVKQGRVLAFSMLWVSLVAYGLGSHYLDQIRERTRTSQQMIQDLERNAGDIEVKAKLLKSVDAERQRSSLPLRLVLELYDLTPTEIAVNQMVIDSKGRLILSGEAPEYGSVFKYLAALNKSELFSNVSLLFAGNTSANEQKQYDFKLECKIRELNQPKERPSKKERPKHAR